MSCSFLRRRRISVCVGGCRCLYLCACKNCGFPTEKCVCVCPATVRSFMLLNHVYYPFYSVHFVSEKMNSILNFITNLMHNPRDGTSFHSVSLHSYSKDHAPPPAQPPSLPPALPTVAKNSKKSRRKYWATHSSVCLYSYTALSFAALLALL